MTARASVAVLVTTFALALSARADGDGCQDWPLRLVDGVVAYDGDTLYSTVPGLPSELKEITIRLRGIDAPEIRGAKCEDERIKAKTAKARLDELVRAARYVTFCNLEWDKYGGRVLAEVVADGHDVGSLLVIEGLARPYDGDTRESWCG